MLLASYVGTHSGIHGVGNIAIRFRLSGLKQALQLEALPGDETTTRASHSEIVFEPGDGVDSLMPDGTTQPDASGALWCVSSTGFDRLPTTSKRRPGKIGGVRFKRINVTSNKWRTKRLRSDPLVAATLAHKYEGTPYDFKLIAKELVWFLPQGKTKMHCSEISATLLRLREAYRFNPCILEIVADFL